MVKRILVAVVILLLAVIAIRLISGEDNWVCQNGEWVKHGNPSSPQPTGTCGQVTPTLPITPMEEKNIIVEAPKEGETVSSPFILKGQARVFENQLNYRLKDGEGRILSEGSLYADAPDIGQYGPFEKEISFPITSKAIVLEVFDYSAKDGSERDKVEINLKVDNG